MIILPLRDLSLPFVGFIEENQKLLKQDEEVQEIVKIPMNFFINKNNYKERCYMLKNELIAVGRYTYIAPNNKKYVNFGVTAHIWIS